MSYLEDMAGLNPYDLSQCFSLAEIETEIALWKGKLEEATVKSYSKDTTQGSQKVDSAEIAGIENILQRWLRAKAYKNGSAGPNIVSADYRPIVQRGSGF